MSRADSPAGTSGSASAPGRAVATPTAAPRATRLARPSWLDLRLVAGVVLVLLAVLGGARVVSNAGHTTQIWSVNRDLAPGATLSAGDLVPAAVHFASALDAERYLPASGGLPVGAHLARSVSAGELLPRNAVTVTAGAMVALPLSLLSANVPPGLRVGTLVDVWAVPAATAGLSGTARPVATEVLSGVPVWAVSGSGSFGSTGTTVVTVSVARDNGVAAVLAGVSGKAVVLLPVTQATDQSGTAAGAPAPPTASPANPGDR